MALDFKSLITSKQQLFILIAAFILFALAVLVGISSGRSNAKVQADYQSIIQINSALKYFYSDNDRYPSADQFMNQKILVPNYLAAMPVMQATGGACKDSTGYFYAQTAPANFSIKFCLAKSTNGLTAGTHELSESGLR